MARGWDFLVWGTLSCTFKFEKAAKLRLCWAERKELEENAGGPNQSDSWGLRGTPQNMGDREMKEFRIFCSVAESFFEGRSSLGSRE